MLAIGLSAVFLFPFIEQSLSQTFSYMTAKWFEPSNINALLSVFSSSVFTNVFFSSVGGGIALLVMVVLSILFDHDKLSVFIICIVLITSLITTNIIDISQTTYANILQFSFRLHLVTYPLAAYLGGRVLDKYIKNKIVIYSLSVLICLYSLVNVCLFTSALKDNSEFIDSKATAEEVYDTSELKKYYTVNIWQIGNGEYLPSETSRDILNDTLSIKERVSEYGLIDTIINGDYERNGTRFTFDFNSDKETELMLPQTYYKGYQVYLIDENQTKLNFYSYPYFNQITFKTVP